MYLLKTEPSEYSFDHLERDKETVWDGVKNPLAQRFISQMKKGDLCFIYHTGKERAVVGIGEVSSEPYKDSNNLWVVRVRPVKRLKRPVSLEQIKRIEGAKDFYLVRMPRLSVMPVPKEIWEAILSLSS